jgi:hypothetical protein
MGIYLNPGNDAFQISVQDDIYIDKSGLISFTNSRIGKRKRYLCVSRPRRFGKSMAAEMLLAYYSKGCNSRELFQKLEIYQDVSFEKHLNRYDVIYLNMQQMWDAAGKKGNLPEYISEMVLEELKTVYDGFFEKTDTHLPTVLSKIYAKIEDPKKGFIFIFDEWDCLFREAKEDTEHQKKYLDFLRDLLKDRTYVKLTYMTGILPIKKYGTHSALNVFDEISMTNADEIAEYTGFTEKEVYTLCTQYGKSFEELKRWYDGYRIGDNVHIYNPKSVIDAIQNRKIKSFWAGTETYEALQIYIDLNFDGLKDEIISMLGGGNCLVDIGSFQNDMTTFKTKDDVLTLLIHLGYLAYDEENSTVFIPNEEVRGEFIRAIKNGDRPELVKAIQKSDELMEATLNGREEQVAELIETVHRTNTAPQFYNNEQALRSVIKLAYYSQKDDYFTIHELPGGNGYADIVFLPKQGVSKPAMIIELKWNKTSSGAIQQMKEKHYVQGIEEYGGEILLVGINYDKKNKKHTCKIESYKK